MAEITTGRTDHIIDHFHKKGVYVRRRSSLEEIAKMICGMCPVYKKKTAGRKKKEGPLRKGERMRVTKRKKEGPSKYRIF